MLGLSSKQFIVFSITYLCLVARRASLQGRSILKPEISSDLEFSSMWLGVFDTVYLVTYAVGKIINGYLSDKLPTNKVVGVGLIGACFALSLLSLFGFLGLNLPGVFLGVWFL